MEFDTKCDPRCGLSEKVKCTLYLFNVVSKHNVKIKVLKEKYFREENISLTEISKITNITRERVRQIVNNFQEYLIPKCVSQLITALNGTELDLTKNLSKDINVIEVDGEKQFLISGYQPNISFYFALYNSLPLDEYTELNTYVFNKKKQPKSFTRSSSPVLVRNELLRNLHFTQLLEWSDSQVYDFELSSFQYNDNVLIKRYYNENGIELSASDLESANYLFSLLKRTDWTADESKIKKVKKAAKFESLISDIENFINASRSSKKTADILDYLTSLNYTIELQQLLKILGSKKSRFKAAGTGYWGTPEILEADGSIRSIIQKLLNGSEDPLHISDILNYVLSFRPTSEISLWTNLKVEESNSFEFFNCKFVGLKCKTYNQYWYELPQTRGTLFRQELLVGRDLEEIVSDYSKKYGYPEKHTRYLLKKNLNCIPPSNYILAEGKRDSRSAILVSAI